MSDNYFFNGYISEQVLRRYLSRSISYPIYDAGKKAEDEVDPDTDTKADYWYYLTDMGDGATVKAVWDKYAAELD